ncbi:hypothetical protein BG006_003179 [Podila minutissima]|uniref:Uncharacterized protein n=1 Tax=Podila minutissima TaxID=64525 RepID=A0A9P5SRN4_9FUNG|nr:hypothetical protein BG006_003179 [Podila minutissima]
MLNELSRIEMFVTRIETVGKQEEIVTELSRTVTHLEQTLYNFELENGQGARTEDASGRVMLQRYMIRTGLVEMFPKSSEHLGIDPVIAGASFLEGTYKDQYSSFSSLICKQCINQAGPLFSKYKARVEEQFNTLKEVTNQSDEPCLTPELQSWLSELTTDIVADALFSGRAMSQQTPEGAHLSDYINRVSSGNTWENNQIHAS